MSHRRPTLVMIGAGPRVAGVLERLAASAPELLRSPVDLHLVDPQEPGSGRVWRHHQYAGLLLNSMAQDITLFTDGTVHCAGPRAEGPDLLAWAELLTAGELDDDGHPADPALEDPALLAEAAALRTGSFPSRRLFGAYARWFLHRAVLRLAPRARVTVHRDTATAVHHDDAGYRVQLGSGPVLDADVVLYSLGHSDARPDARERTLTSFAERHGGLYLPPAYTADADYSGIAPGQDVLVSGMGLAFVDLVVLLFEGRGGRFIPQPEGGFDYTPSGREPRLWAGSRRGVPYHAKPQVPLRGPAPSGTRYLTQEAVGALLSTVEEIGFREHLWPLVAKDVAHAYYTELFAASPERVDGPWDAFERRLDTVIWGSTEQRRLLADFIPDPAYRLDFEQVDRPLGTGQGPESGGLADREAAVLRHVEEDLRLRGDTDHSEQTALFTGFLYAYFSLGTLVPVERLSASALAEINEWWHGFFSFIDSGPPPHRLEEMLALHRGGFLRFLGPGAVIAPDEASGRFVASLPGSDDTVSASVFVEARLPEPTVEGSRNPALWQLGSSGLGREKQVLTRAGVSSSGRLAVDAQQRILGPDGAERRHLFAVGPWTSAWGSAAFARPRTNAAPFRENDALARRLLKALNDVADSLAATGTAPAPERLRA
ncbi:FAD/NAD(P)-binding protein [Arthrobacter woluwensis]|uniref:FAD/NAD(P)-binding protein n=1 Tax=Arthrobacter woluwensis TaxID=156980 RepID=UPI001AAFD5DC|nr:FAD/NAD(P)-binding protein [Arthrobacter woluwensis]QTF73106.1 FAD/NAD(P)-binding protein [Arthrobacter woluwensis]